MRGLPPERRPSLAARIAPKCSPRRRAFDRVRQVLARTKGCACAAAASDARYERLLVIDPEWYF